MAALWGAINLAGGARKSRRTINPALDFLRWRSEVEVRALVRPKHEVTNGNKHRADHARRFLGNRFGVSVCKFQAPSFDFISALAWHVPMRQSFPMNVRKRRAIRPFSPSAVTAPKIQAG